jgi:hypothetical protein
MTDEFTNHRWSGWPGAWCLDCGLEDPIEQALADGLYEFDEDGETILNPDAVVVPPCPCPDSGNHDPYRAHNKEMCLQYDRV